MTPSDEPTKDIERLIITLQQTNRSLRSRAVVLGVFLVIALGFAIRNHDQKYVAHDLTYGLSSLSSLAQISSDSMEANLKEYAQSYDMELSPYIDWVGIQLELKQSNYKDKTPLIRAHEKLSDLRRTVQNGNGYDNINILGLSMPALPWVFLGGVIIMFLFHDFTIMMFHRRRIMQNLEGKADDVLHGSELFSTTINYVPNELSGYIGFVASGIILIFLLIPLITVIFFFWASTQIDLRGFSQIAVLINATATAVIFTDFVLLLYYENIFGIKTACNYVVNLGSLRNVPARKKLRRVMLLFSIPFIPVILFAGIQWYWNPYIIFKPTLFGILFLQCVLLPIGLILRSNNSIVRLISDMLVITGLGMFLFWFLYVLGVLFHLIPFDLSITGTFGIMAVCFLASIFVAILRIRMKKG